MTFYDAARLDLTNMPHPDPGDGCRVADDESPSRPPRFLLHRLLHWHLQPVTERVPKLEGAIRLIRTSIDPAWAAVALLMIVLLGGFTWLSTELHRIEAKVDAVSISLAEMPGTLQGELQAQSERLTALISLQRQSGTAGPPRGAVSSARGGAPAAAHIRVTNESHVVSKPASPPAAGSGGASPHGGATDDAATTKVANRTAFTGNPRRP